MRKSFKARAMVGAPGRGQNGERSQVASLQTELKAGEQLRRGRQRSGGRTMENLESEKSCPSREQKVPRQGAT